MRKSKAISLHKEGMNINKKSSVGKSNAALFVLFSTHY
jgi:hypothetical protein